MLILQLGPGIRRVSVDVVMGNQMPRLTSPTFCLTRGGETWLNPAHSHCGEDKYPRVCKWGSCWSSWKINPLSNEKYGPPTMTPHVPAGVPPPPVGTDVIEHKREEFGRPELSFAQERVKKKKRNLWEHDTWFPSLEQFSQSKLF